LNQNITQRYYRKYSDARLMVLLIVCFSAFLTPLSLSATLVAIPAISIGLAADAVYASWIPAAFLLSNLIALLPGGRLADVYGRKRMFLLGNLLFALACILAGLASSIEMLLAFRVLQGIGAALFFSTGMAILSSVFRDSGRGAALGWMVASVYLGLSSGPLIGGWVVDQWGWHAVFFIQVPLALVNILVGLSRLKGEWRSQEAYAVDWTGAALIALAMICFFAGFTNLVELWGQGVLLGSLLLLYAFIRHSLNTAYPLVNIPLVIQNHTYSRALLASVFMYSGQYGLLFLMGLFLQYNRGLTPTEAGQLLILQAIVMAVFAPIAGRLSDRWGSKLLATGGCLIIGAGLSVLSFVDNSMPIFLIAAALMVIGLGHGLFSTPNNSAALGAIPESRLGIASALLNQSRLIGQLLGTAIVSLLLALNIGNHVIDETHFASLLRVTQVTIGLSFLFAIAAAYFSYQKPRGSS
jgi:EmrB/QacA subfamily drug resistance transporter